MSDRRNSAAYRAVSGRLGPRGEAGPDFRSRLLRVVAASGSVAGAARDLGVPRRTLRRWLSGESQPPAARRAQVDAAALALVRRARLNPDREKRLRKARTVVIVATYRYDALKKPGITPRTITFRLGANGSDGMRAGAVGLLLSAFLGGTSGDDSYATQPGLFEPLAYSMTDTWYREAFLSADAEHGFDVERVVIK